MGNVYIIPSTQGIKHVLDHRHSWNMRGELHRFEGGLINKVSTRVVSLLVVRETWLTMHFVGYTVLLKRA